MIWPLFVVALPPGYLAYTVWTEIRLADELVRNGVECPGLVISQRTVNRARGKSFTVPKVRFTTLEGMVIEGESQGLERAYGNKGLFFADRADFLNNADAYLCYSPQNPKRFLFVRQLDQTRNWYIFLLTTAVAVTSLFYALFGKG